MREKENILPKISQCESSWDHRTTPTLDRSSITYRFVRSVKRLEILLELKGAGDRVEFQVVDITKPRPERLLRLSGGTTALPVMELPGERGIKESLVLMDYLETRFPGPPVRRADPYERAVENMMVALEGEVVASGYRLILNQDRDQTQGLVDAYFGALQPEKSLVFLYVKRTPLTNAW